jgi:hypothetical protein
MMSETYRIQVEGRLRAGWSDWFDGMNIVVEKEPDGPTISTLTGPVADQAALHGILNRVRDLGLTLVSVQRLQS